MPQSTTSSDSKTTTTTATEFPQRADRLHEAPSARNAQGLFLPSACIFVGNLSTRVDTGKLAKDLETHFSKYGRCHVKIKQDKKKCLPGAFVQFEIPSHAEAALECQDQILHDRRLRIERAKGQRTAILGYRSFFPISRAEGLEILKDSGHLEDCVAVEWPCRYNNQTYKTQACKVRFAYVDDCRDAIKHFQRDDTCYLHLTDMDSSPKPSEVWEQRRSRYHSRYNFSSPPGYDAGNNHPRGNDHWRGRGGYPTGRGDFSRRGVPPRGRGFSYPRNSSSRGPRYVPHQSRQSFSNEDGTLPGFTEAFNPPHGAHGPYPDSYPFMPMHTGLPPNFNGPQGFMPYHHPMQPPIPQQLPHPVQYPPNFNNGPFIVDGNQPPYGPPMPPTAFYPENYPGHSFNNQPAGYFYPGPPPQFQSAYYEPYNDAPSPAGQEQPTQQHCHHKPITTEESTPELTKARSDRAFQKLLKRRRPDKAPRLIRVDDSDTESGLDLETDSTIAGETDDNDEDDDDDGDEDNSNDDGNDNDDDDDNESRTPKNGLDKVTDQISALSVKEKLDEKIHVEIAEVTESHCIESGSTPVSEAESEKKGGRLPEHQPKDCENTVCDSSGVDESCQEQNQPGVVTSLPSGSAGFAVRESDFPPLPRSKSQEQESLEAKPASTKTKPVSAEVKSAPAKAESAPLDIPTDSPLEKFRFFSRQSADERGWGDREDLIEQVAIELWTTQENNKTERAKQQKMTAVSEKLGPTKGFGKETEPASKDSARSSSLVRSGSLKSI